MVPTEPTREEPQEQTSQGELYEQAVVKVSPSDTGSTNEPPSDGVVPNVLTLQPDSAEESATSSSPFWQEPVERGKYFHAPYTYSQFRLLAEQVEMVAEYLRSRGYEAKRHELIHRLYTDVLPAAEEFERLRHELEPQRRDIEKAIRETEERLQETEKQVYTKLAEARLPVSQPLLNGKQAKKAPTPSEVSPAFVEQVLNNAFANSSDICGEQGISPPREQQGNLLSRFEPVGHFLLELLAPLTAGMLLGINIGVITGFLSLSELLQLKKPFLFGFAALVGFFVEKMGGTIYYALSSSIAQASEKREVGNEVQPFPSVRNPFPFGLLCFAAILLGLAIVTVDGLGLRMLHEEALRNAQIVGARVGETLPLGIYFVAGAIIGLPYLIYKAVRGWRDSEIRQREARIGYLRWQHIEQRRSEPAVQEAFALAQEAVGLREQLQRLQQQRAFICQRLDSARTQAIGCHEEFRNYFQQLLQEMDGVYPARGGAESRESGTSSTWLGRLLGRLFGRR